MVPSVRGWEKTAKDLDEPCRRLNGSKVHNAAKAFTTSSVVQEEGEVIVHKALTITNKASRH